MVLKCQHATRHFALQFRSWITLHKLFLNEFQIKYGSLTLHEYRMTGKFYITVTFFLELISALRYILFTANIFRLKLFSFTLHYLDFMLALYHIKDFRKQISSAMHFIMVTFWNCFQNLKCNNFQSTGSVRINFVIMSGWTEKHYSQYLYSTVSPPVVHVIPKKGQIHNGAHA